MKIIALEAENVKRIKAVSIKPDGSIVEITGKNGQGKSSILDALFWALTDAKHIQDVPVRKGADRAVIKLDLGKLKVTRVIRAKEDGEFTQSLKVENEEGAAYKSPQSMLDALVGALSFDPLDFTRMKPEAQFDACRRFVPDFDFDANAKTRKEAFDERTAVNRRVKELKAQAEGVTFETVAGEAIDESGLVAQLEAAGQHNADIERRAGNRETARQRITGLTAAAAEDAKAAKDLRAQADAMDERAKAKTAEAEDLQSQLDGAGELPEPIDTAALRDEIDTARAHNAKIERATSAARQKSDLQKLAETAQKKADELTGTIDACDKKKRDAIAKAKLPVAGMTFGDGAVLLDGLPFDQASGAEQLRFSCAVAAALNPKLRVLRVKDGALLDTDSMKLLSEFAEQNDMQVWVETVASDRPGAVVIEDGCVKGAAAESEAA